MKKPIIVRENGKLLKDKLRYPFKDRKNFKATSGLQAAALQESDDDPIPTFVGHSGSNYSKSQKKNSKFSYFKPILMAIFSAISIGAILGFILIRMFVGIDAELTNNSANSIPVVNSNDKTETAGTDLASLAPMEAFVLQAGVFSEKVNAVNWAKDYHNSGLSTMVWEKENQYFLLVGVAGTQEQAENIAGELKDSNFDIYVKPWTTGKGEQKLSDAEQGWFQSFQKQWNKALASISNEEAFSPSSWEEILAETPAESERVSNVAKEISSKKQADGMKAQIQLLNIWNKYYQEVK